MHFFSTERPSFGEKREFLRLTDPRSGRPIGAMPLLYVTPVEGGEWRIGAHVQVGGNRFGTFEFIAKGDKEALEFLSLWREDTERALGEYMKYDFDQAEHISAARKAKTAAKRAAPVGLEALGYNLDGE